MRRGVRRAARGRASVRAGTGASRAGRTERQRRRGAKLQKSPRPQGVGLPQTRAGVKTRARNAPPQWGYCLPSGYDLGAFAPRGKVCVYLLQGRGEEKCGRGGCCVAKGRDRPGWLVRGARRYPRGRKRMRRRKAPDRAGDHHEVGGAGCAAKRGAVAAGRCGGRKTAKGKACRSGYPGDSALCAGISAARLLGIIFRVPIHWGQLALPLWG